jgi:hypothetical protein
VEVVIVKRIYVIFALLVLLVVPAQASASSYYTLEGTVSQISDYGGLASAAGVSIGDTVKYVIEIDTDRTGYYTKSNGRVKTVKDSYYTSLYSGILSGMTTQEYNYLDPYYEGFYSQTGNEYSATAIQNWTGYLEDLSVGSSVDAMSEFAFNENWGYSEIRLDSVTVTSISNVAPTPIPGAAILMLGGLGVVGFVRRKMA